MFSQALRNAQSIEDVVKIVNQDGTSQLSGDEIAGQWAWDAAKDEDDTSVNNREAHLEYLVEAGANFDLYTALKTENPFDDE